MAYVINITGFIGDAGFMGGDQFTLKDLNRLLDAMPVNTKEIDVVINSGGGYVTEGFAIHDRLSEVEPIVNTKVLGICGSIATVIAQAAKSQGKGGMRSGYKNSDYFIHNPSWSPQSPDPIEADELKRIYEDLKSNEEKLINFYADTTGVDAETFRTKMNEAKSLSMEETKDLGLIDKIISTNIQAATVYKFAAHIKTTPSPMATIAEQIKNEFEAMKADMKALFKPRFKNETTKTSEGVDIFYEGELNVGTKVYIDAEMTQPAPDGVHTVGDMLYTVAAGEVTKVEPVTQDKSELEIANEKIAKLTAELAGKDAEIDSKINAAIASKEQELTAKTTEAVNSAVTARETELTNKFNKTITDFTNKYFTGDGLKPEFIQAMKNEGNEQRQNTNETPVQISARLAREAREKAAAGKK